MEVRETGGGGRVHVGVGVDDDLSVGWICAASGMPSVFGLLFEMSLERAGFGGRGVIWGHSRCHEEGQNLELTHGGAGWAWDF